MDVFIGIFYQVLGFLFSSNFEDLLVVGIAWWNLDGTCFLTLGHALSEQSEVIPENKFNVIII